ncbi:hypothetical protein D9M70_574530 [compost metagenome]
MRVGQIKHVDVVAHAGAVARVVVRAEDLEALPAAKGSVDRKRDRVRLGLVPLADAAFRIGARGVEVAKDHRTKTLVLAIVLECLLAHPFCPAVGVDRRLAVLLVDRHAFRQAIGGAGR